MKLAPAHIRDRFRERGLKSTPQRTAIYRALAETTRHPTAGDLYKQVSRSQPMISPNTVYYTLSVLKEAGLVQEVNYRHDRARFDANVTPHHHLICMKCQRIQDLTDKTLDRVRSSPNIPKDFTVTEHQVQFYGYCGTCRPTSVLPEPDSSLLPSATQRTRRRS